MKRLGIIIFLSSVPTFAALPELEPAFNGQSRMASIETETSSPVGNAGSSVPPYSGSSDNVSYASDNNGLESHLGSSHALEMAEENSTDDSVLPGLTLAEPVTPAAGKSSENELSNFGRPNRGPNVGGFSSLGTGPSMQSGFGLSGGGVGLSGSPAAPATTSVHDQSATGTVYYLANDGSQGESGTIYYYYPPGGYGGSSGYGYGGSGNGYGNGSGYGGGYSADAAPEPSSLVLGLLCTGAFAGLMARFRPTLRPEAHLK